MGIYAVDTRAADWSRTSVFLYENALAILKAGSYLYIYAQQDRIHLLEQLLRDLELEDHCCILQSAETAPADAIRLYIG